jgi:hypothetical protein
MHKPMHKPIGTMDCSKSGVAFILYKSAVPDVVCYFLVLFILCCPLPASGVCLMDDDRMVDVADMNFGFEVWKVCLPRHRAGCGATILAP